MSRKSVTKTETVHWDSGFGEYAMLHTPESTVAIAAAVKAFCENADRLNAEERSEVLLTIKQWNCTAAIVLYREKPAE